MKKDELKNRNKISVFMVVIATIIIFIGIFVRFHKKIYDMTIEKNMTQIEEQSENIINILENEMDDYVVMLSQAEKFITKESEIYSKDMQKSLANMKNGTGFYEIGIIDSNGKMITSKNLDKRFVHGKYFRKLEKDNLNRYKFEKGVYISDVFKEKGLSSKSMMIMVPIELENRFDYCIYGKFDISYLVKEFRTSKESNRYFQIVDNSGMYIYASDNEHVFAEEDNIWKQLRKFNYTKKKNSTKTIYQAIKQGKKGNFYIEYKGEGRYISYKPIGINNWYIFSVQTEDDMNSYVTELWREVIKLSLAIVIVLVILLCIILVYIKKSKQDIKDKDEKISIQNSIFQLVLNKVDNIPFEIDLSKKEITLYMKDDKSKKTVNLNRISPENFFKKGIIEKDEYDEYSTIYNKIINAEEIKSELIHIHTNEGFYWIKINTVVIHKNNGSKHIVGIFEDYNEQMNKETKIKEHLEAINIMGKKNRTDFLTSIYNREGVIQEVNYYLSLENISSTKDIFLILDLDNFKSVNDFLGHAKGDEVLKDTAKILREHLAKSDIVGRIGGDEFIAYIRNIEEMKDVRSIAYRLNKLLERNIEKDGLIVKISASIGIVIVEKSDKKFEDLYEKADTALYMAKRNNKNTYHIYDTYEKR